MADENSKTLEQALWNSANVLRGKMDASEYKNYLLGLIFYRFLSEKTLKAVVDETEESGEPIDIYRDYWNKQQDDIVAALYDRLGFIIKPDNLFDSFVYKIQTHQFQISDLKQALFDLEQSVKGQRSEEDFTGLFSDIDLDSNRLGKNPSQVMNDTIMSLKDIDFADDRDVLGDAYEYLISEFAMNAGKKLASSILPEPLVKSLLKL